MSELGQTEGREDHLRLRAGRVKTRREGEAAVRVPGQDRKAPAAGVGDADGFIEALPARQGNPAGSPESVQEFARADELNAQIAMVTAKRQYA
ncbi:hypothetical protein AA309_19890 [Microvirga vignae]|uniref:Uncharacterized protein n=1 Tax=Microvirga vignae TaxID=1225564 RepID=A0A0H1R8K9_9HYPH|nr:hypothetical protein AA309_19890 [Microvirga vignae]